MWDWLQLLIVPLILALITVVFTWQQNSRQNDLEDQRTRQAQKIENQRAEAERELAEQRAQDESLQAYLDQMSTLMLENGLRESDEDSEVRTLARARTLTVLRRMDTSRKDEIIQFLQEANLVQKVGNSAPVIGLCSVALGGTDLQDADLSGANLCYSDLSGANLQDADLSGAEVFRANLQDADLKGAHFRGAVLRHANLQDADVSGANLRYAILSGADVRRGALRDAHLNSADLEDADLSHADLQDADLSHADLQDADLSHADLRGAIGILDARSLEGVSLEDATMPNGQKYEDWLKSRDSGEDGEDE